MKNLPDGTTKSAASPAHGESAMWGRVLEMVRARQYREAAYLLDRAPATFRPEAAHGSTAVLLATRQLCLACDRFLEEARLLHNAVARAGELERELQGHLLAIVQQAIRPLHAAPPVELPRAEIVPVRSTAGAGVAPAGGESSAQASGTWQRIQQLLSAGESHAARIPPPDIDPEVMPIDRGSPGKPGANAPSIIVFCLGNFRLYDKDRLIQEWPNRRSKSVLKYLLLHRDHPVRKDVLMETFWPEHDAAAARNNLNVAVYTLRQTLRALSPDPSYVKFHDESYFLNPELDIWLDVEEFQERLSAAQSALRRGRFEQAVRDYETAVELNQGELLEDDLYEPWAASMRQDLHRAHVGALTFLSAYYYEQGHDAACVGYCRKLLAVEPAEEAIHRRLMRAYVRQNQRYLAIRQYQQCVEALRDELDIGPDPKTVRLYQAILDNRPV